ncbi:hypothetical protein [Brucella pseudogrignonensis]|uniref:hypothetical protein n=1 Tax=Brucella pseudogrignonensis TaxID=419475 RepID=UPI0038D145A0
MASKEHEALIETVAKSLADKERECLNLPYRDRITSSDLEMFMPLAQAAISTILTALQEPTQDMVRSVKHDLAWYHAKETWRAMLNASPLGEHSE